MDLTQTIQSVLGEKGGDMLGPLLGMLGGGAQAKGLQAGSPAAAAPGGGAGGAGGPNGGLDLPGLLDKFKESGLGDQLESWIGTGKNKPVTPDQVKDALGADRVEQMARQAGVSAQEEADGIAKSLPQLIDKLSPEGKLPDASSFQNALGKAIGGSR